MCNLFGKQLFNDHGIISCMNLGVQPSGSMHLHSKSVRNSLHQSKGWPCCRYIEEHWKVMVETEAQWKAVHLIQVNGGDVLVLFT